jgi:phosphopantothenoylcysteine decarboxylase/phosphopantothenate--cysteine ligase
MALIALGVTGGIGAYKAIEVARGLQKLGHDVVAVMTKNARRFVGPVTFEAITKRKVVTTQWAAGANADIEHIALASTIDVLIVAPATANIIGKFAAGIADDFLSTLYLATKAPMLLAPAMNSQMLEHPATTANMKTLADRGVHIIEPDSGYLACGWTGRGRLAEPSAIVDAAIRLLTPRQSLAGRTVLVTAGPTFEDLDPVRFLGNRSSGKMGSAIAAEAARRGACVTLVVGPTAVTPPETVEVVHVRSAEQMRDAVMSRVATADIVVMAAAVADYRPADAATQKITKSDGPMTLTLVRTPDILSELGAWRAERGGRRPVLVGFAAETQDVEASARRKLTAKRVDLIVANDVLQAGAGFESDTNVVTMVGPNASEAIPLQAKTAIAGLILDRAEALLS